MTSKIVIIFCLLIELVINKETSLCVYTGYNKSSIDREQTRRHCPLGVLLDHPTTISIHPDFQHVGAGFCSNPDICTTDGIFCNDHKNFVSAQLIVGNITLIELPDSFEPEDNGFRTTIDSPTKCHLTIHPDSQGSKEDPLLKRSKRTLPGETNILVNYTASKQMIDDTRSMFYFLATSATNPKTEATTNDPLIQLLEPSFNVIQKRCEPTKLDPFFIQTVHKAFVWLLQNTMTIPTTGDIPHADIEASRTALLECAMKPNPIKIHGTECLDRITQVSKRIQDIDAVKTYVYDDRVFTWGKYDPVVDAVWLTIDSIHGLCENELSHHLVQHKYFLYMMRLLNFEQIKNIWKTPTPLMRHEVYDQMFLAPVNESLALLDACNVGAYIGSQYPGRSVRKIDEEAQRRRRMNQRNKYEPN